MRTHTLDREQDGKELSGVAVKSHNSFSGAATNGDGRASQTSPPTEIRASSLGNTARLLPRIVTITPALLWMLVGSSAVMVGESTSSRSEQRPWALIRAPFERREPEASASDTKSTMSAPLRNVVRSTALLSEKVSEHSAAPAEATDIAIFEPKIRHRTVSSVRLRNGQERAKPGFEACPSLAALPKVQ
jgi:hypothetical protein